MQNGSTSDAVHSTDRYIKMSSLITVCIYLPQSLKCNQAMRLLLLSLFLVLCCTTFAQKNSSNQNAVDTVLIVDSTRAPVITKHEVTINGQVISYTVTAGYLPLKDQQGKIKANIFFVAYTKDGTNKDTRPITYDFNGGH